MHTFKIIVAFLGRLLISLIFIIAGLNKIFDWQTVEAGFITTLTDWHNYVHNVAWLACCFEFFIRWVSYLLGIAIAFELIGGLLILFGIRVRIGAVILILFLIPATILYHHFWFLEGKQHSLELVMFLKNLAILGGLLNLLAFGAVFRGKRHPVMPMQ